MLSLRKFVSRCTRPLLLAALLLPAPAFAEPALVFSSYLGEAADDVVYDIAVDAAGNTWIAGVSGDRPLIAKLGPTGSRSFSRTIVLGNYGEGRSIALGPDGAVYLAGYVDFGLGSDEIEALFARIDPLTGAVLAWQSFGDGPASIAEEIAVDTQGRVWMGVSMSLGSTYSLWSVSPGGAPQLARAFPDDEISALATRGSDVVLSGVDYDANFSYVSAYVERRTAAGAVVFRTAIQGTRQLYFPRDVAVAPDGSIYVTGLVNRQGGDDAFVAKLDAAGHLRVMRYFGGHGEDFGRAIAIAPSGEVIVAGSTASVDFPVVGGLQAGCDTSGAESGGDCADAFVTRLNSQLQVVWSTYLGGAGYDAAEAVAVGPEGDIRVAGGTASTNFPTVHAFDRKNTGVDGFVARIGSRKAAQKPVR